MNKRLPLTIKTALESYDRMIFDLLMGLESARVDIESLKPLAHDNAASQVLGDNLDEYIQALSGEGPLAYTWQDKPHRLVFSLVRLLRERESK